MSEEKLLKSLWSLVAQILELFCFLLLEHSTVDQSLRSSIHETINEDDDNADDEKSNETDDKTNGIPRLSSSSQNSSKIFVIDCVEKLIKYCQNSSLGKLHFDFISAEEYCRNHSKNDFLVFHLSELVTFSLVSCRSNNDTLRSSGLRLLKDILRKFSEPKQTMEMNPHRLLEDYQIQISAALRPLFTRETLPELTAEACDLCRLWIAEGVGDDHQDLRRAHQLLISSLEKLTRIQNQQKIADEHSTTMENLAILKLWADVYHLSTDRADSNLKLFNLIQPELDILIYHWLAAFTDYALLNLPNEFNCRNRIEPNGNFYSAQSDVETVKKLYQNTWFSYLRAITKWLVDNQNTSQLFGSHRKFSSQSRQDILLNKFLSLTLTDKLRIIPENKDDLFQILLGSSVCYSRLWIQLEYLFFLFLRFLLSCAFDRRTDR